MQIMTKSKLQEWLVKNLSLGLMSNVLIAIFVSFFIIDELRCFNAGVYSSRISSATNVFMICRRILRIFSA